jgi:hypothetical protein
MMSDFKNSRHSILPELLGPLYTPELQQRLQSCTTADDLFPVVSEQNQAKMTVADAAAAFVLPPRSSATEDANYALALELRILTGQVARQEEMEMLWDLQQQSNGTENLPATVKHLLAAAHVLQSSSELASAGSLPYNAELPEALQCSTTAQVAHYITTADILGMPRQDLPALVAALRAAEVCLGRMACPTQRHGFRTDVEPVGATEGQSVSKGRRLHRRHSCMLMYRSNQQLCLGLYLPK